MKESKLKSQLTKFMFISKILVLFYIIFEYTARAYSLEQTLALIALIIPLFAVYLTTMLKDAGSNRHITADPNAEALVRVSYAKLSRLLFFIYPAGIIGVVFIGGEMGENGFVFAQSTLAIIETALGVYIGQVVMDLYKTNK